VSDVRGGIVGESKNVRIDHLLLDIENPRFVLGPDVKTQYDIVDTLVMQYDVLTLAESIASTGFHANSPLVAIPADSDGHFIVVEGNRRLAALKGLCDADFRAHIWGKEKWEKYAKDSAVDGLTEVPVIVIAERDKADSMLGFTHITGILDWEPLRQARFVAKLIDKDGLSFQEAAVRVGKTKTDVAAMYRNQGIALQAEQLGFPASTFETKYSYLTVAMGSNLRVYVDAPAGNHIAPHTAPIGDENIEKLDELLTWLFGKGDEAPVVKESREIGKLAKVVADVTGRAKLKESGDLGVALDAMRQAGLDPRVRLINRLKATLAASTEAMSDLEDFATDPQAKQLVSEISESVTALSEVIDAAN